MKDTKRFALLLALVIVFSVFAFSVSASANDGSIPNSEVTGHTAAEYATLCRLVDAANLSITALVRIAQLTPYNDVPWLLSSVNAIASAVFAYADSIGAQVVCEYVGYYVDGQYVMIDPIWVIPPLPPEPIVKD